jgi:hypothetical protein
MTVTVRLFPEIHGTVLDALARVPCGCRSARVIHLVTIGLIYERACGVAGASPTSAPPAGAMNNAGSDAVDMRSDDAAYLTALLDGAGQ